MREGESFPFCIMFKRCLSIAATLLLIGCQSNPTAELVRELNPDGYKDATVAVLPLITSGLPAEAGRYHGDRIVDELVRSGRYRVLERSLVDRILEEQKFQNSGVVDTDQAARIGRLLSARLVITGMAYGRPDGADLFIRLIDVESGVILKSAHRQVRDGRPSDDRRRESDSGQSTSEQNAQTDKPNIARIKPIIGEVKADDEAQREARGEILDLAAIPSVGNIVVIGRMRNTGSITIGTPSLRVGLFDAKGEEIDSVQCFPGVDLPPGALLPFQCVSLNTRDRFASTRLLHFKPQPTRSDLYVHDLSVVRHNLRYDGFAYNLTGTIQHSGKIPVKYPRVIASFFDAGGSFIGSAQGFGDDKELQPGQQTRFQASLWALGGRKPARYEMVVVGLRN